MPTTTAQSLLRRREPIAPSARLLVCLLAVAHVVPVAPLVRQASLATRSAETGLLCRTLRRRAALAGLAGCSHSSPPRVEEAQGRDVEVQLGVDEWAGPPRDDRVRDRRVREILARLRESKGAGARECCVRQIAEVAQAGNAAAVRGICQVLDNNKEEAVLVREAAVQSLEGLCGAGGAADRIAFRSLMASVKNDAAYVVRRACFQLVPKVAHRLEDREEVLELAMSFLRKEDMRNQPLFKPNGDPLSLNAEAVQALGLLGARGNSSLWDVLERRAMDDASSSTRVAAVKALARLADGDILASGGRRSTVHLLAIGAANPLPAMSTACTDALKSLITEQGIDKYFG